MAFTVSILRQQAFTTGVYCDDRLGSRDAGWLRSWNDFRLASQSVVYRRAVIIPLTGPYLDSSLATATAKSTNELSNSSASSAPSSFPWLFCEAPFAVSRIGANLILLAHSTTRSGDSAK